MKKKKETTKTIYSFAVPIYGSLSAEDTAHEFERITELKGEFRPEYVVDESENPNALLHDYFDWDNSTAGRSWRIQQAKDLIRNLRIQVITVVEEGKVSCKAETVVLPSTRAYVNVRTSPKAPRSYVSLQDAMQNDESYKDLFEQSKKEMQSFVEKYSRIEELENVRAEMQKVLTNNITHVNSFVI